MKSIVKDQVQTRKKAENLLDILAVSPANLTSQYGKQTFDCKTFGVALGLYFEKNQNVFSLRNNFRDKSDEDDGYHPDTSSLINTNFINKKLDEFKCAGKLATDQSYYHYLKYLTQSMLAIVNSNSKSKINTTDIAVMFLPFVELNNKFNRILPSHSILLYLINNENLFANDGCVPNEKDDKSKSLFKNNKI